ncbi:MAG: MBL fold metallo-hydrolase [Acidimicrobiales bacterium]|nr:MBL fold metallo-hydrolase [Acidimicrobiales bacterium]
MAPTSALTSIAPGVAAWLGEGGFGRPNAGVVVDNDGLTLVDTLMVPSQWEPFGEALDALGRPIPRVVLTSSHIPFVGGTGRFWAAAFYGTRTASDQLDLPPNVAGYRRLLPDFAAEFPDELGTRPVSHTVERDVALTEAVVVRVTSGQSAENLVVEVPGANVLFAGAMACFGSAPLAFDGDPAAWAGALRQFAVAGRVVVPGHGPIGGADDLLELAGYLEACAAGSIPAGPWDRWRDRHFDRVNLERAAMLAAGDLRPPPSLLAMLGLA